MLVKQFVDKNLGNAAYLIGSKRTRQAILIDPLRNIEPYLIAAKELGLTISHVLETHIHADFISGAREIAARTGALIGASHDAKLQFTHKPLDEGNSIVLGEVVVKVLETPGHSPEHISFTIEKDHYHTEALFSGGALIVGGAARTDLISHHHTKPLAEKLYHTIHHKLLTLPDRTIIYPTHGAGSFCVAPETDERITTIGKERLRNPLVQTTKKAKFIFLATTNLPSYPLYFKKMRAINRKGPKILGKLPSLTPRSPKEVLQWIKRGGIVLDIRQSKLFVRGHIPKSYGISIYGSFPSWVGWLIQFNTRMVIMAKNEWERKEAVKQLVTIGYERLEGYLKGGISAWKRAGFRISRISTMTAHQLENMRKSKNPPEILDVRFDKEWNEGHIPGALHIENGRLPSTHLSFSKATPIVLYCLHGGRSTSGISVLAKKGYTNVILLQGGFAAWQEAGLPIER